MPSKKDRFLSQNHGQISSLTSRFSSYPASITTHSIDAYLSQFDVEHMPTGLKLLQNVDFYDPSLMLNRTRDLGNTVFALNNNSFQDVIFCPMSVTSGNSADAIKRLLQMSMTGISSPRLDNSNFISNVTKLAEPEFTEDTLHKKIVFIDHFIGSGDTIIQVWGGIQQWENENHEYFVGVLVGYSDAIQHVENESAHHLRVVPVIELPTRARAFHPQNRVFEKDEKEILKGYCEKLGLSNRDKYGYNNGQSMVVFSNRISDNVLPILHHTTENWAPLFPRNF